MNSWFSCSLIKGMPILPIAFKSVNTSLKDSVPLNTTVNVFCTHIHTFDYLYMNEVLVYYYIYNKLILFE